MDVRLMPHVEDEFILREVEHLVQGEDQLDRAEVGREMPAVFPDRMHELPAQVLRKFFQLFFVVCFDFVRQHPPHLCSLCGTRPMAA